MDRLPPWGTQAMVLAFCLPLLFGGWLMKINDEGHCQMIWGTKSTRSTCAVRVFTGYDCPGCGMTRCFVSMSHGQIKQAVKFHPWGACFYLLLAAQIPYRLFQIHRICTNRPTIYIYGWTYWMSLFLLLYFIQWFIKMYFVLTGYQ